MSKALDVFHSASARPVSAGTTFTCSRYHTTSGRLVVNTLLSEVEVSKGVHLESSNPGSAHAGLSPA